MGQKEPKYSRLQRWFDRHPVIYGMMFATPSAAGLLVLPGQGGRLGEVRTWVFVLALFVWGTVLGASSRRRRRGD